MKTTTFVEKQPGEQSLTIWRYALGVQTDPTKLGYHAGWVDATLRSDGWFGCTSDFGNYAYRWTHFGPDDFREFFVRLEPDYLCGKIGSRNAYFDDEATEKRIRETILRYRRDLALSKVEAREEWRMLQRMGVANEWAFHEWLTESALEVDSETAVYTFTPEVLMFGTGTLPYLQDAIRQTLKPQSEPAPSEGP